MSTATITQTTTVITTTTTTTTKNGVTKIYCLLDRSGSMAGLVGDTLGGYNAFIKQQKEDPTEAYVTLAIFDTAYDVIYKDMPLQDVPLLTEDIYFARGGTALFDAVGQTVEMIKASVKDEDTKVILLITTDGEENSSTEYKQTVLKQLLDTWQENKNHVVMYFGANVDAFDEAGQLGIGKEFAANYSATGVGTANLYTAMTMTVQGVRGDCGAQGPRGAIGTDGAAWRDVLKDVEGNEDL